MKHLPLLTLLIALGTTACATPTRIAPAPPERALAPTAAPRHSTLETSETPKQSARCTGDVVLDDALDLTQCTKITGNLIIQNWPHAHLSHLPELKKITGSLQIVNSPHLSDLSGLEALTEIGHDLYLVNLPRITSLESLQNLQRIGRDIELVALGVPRCEAENFVRRTRPSDASQHHLTLEHLDDQATCPDPPSTLLDHVIVLHGDEQIPGGRHLQTIHPELARRGRYLYFLALEKGIQIKFISGHRPWSKPPRNSRRLASWHAFGMGLDFNLAHHADMNVANKHFKAEREQWYIVGEIARGLGLVWGESFNDIFHLEWHPGFNDRIRPDEFARLRKLTGSTIKNYRASWTLFDTPPQDHTPTATTCRGGCWHIPDPELQTRISLAEYPGDS